MAALASLQKAWSSALNVELKAELNGNKLVGSDLLQENIKVKKGKSVEITKLGAVVTVDYDEDGNAFPSLTDSTITVTYDQDKFTGFAIQNTDEFFTAPDLASNRKNEIVYEMASIFDEWVYATYPGLASIIIDDGASGYKVVNSTNVLDFWGAINTAFNKANVPKNMRSVTIPYWLDTLTRNLNIANEANVGMGADFVAKVYDIKVYMSNNIQETVTGQFDMVGGYDGAFQGAMAYTRPWMGGLEQKGQDAEAGFIHYVFGGNAVKPEAMIWAKIKQA